MNKQWIYRNGEKPFSVTEIEGTDGQVRYASITKDNTLKGHYPGGQISNLCKSDHDLTPYEPYADFKIDDKVNAWNCARNGIVTSGHFAGLNSEGSPTTFYMGGTSFTRNCLDRCVWNFCEKAKKEDKQHE